MFRSQESITMIDRRFARLLQGAKLLRSLWPQAGESQFTDGFSGGFSVVAFFLGGLGAVPISLTKIVVFPENPENGQVLKSAESTKKMHQKTAVKFSRIAAFKGGETRGVFWP